jgi:hypothetical protein
LPALQLDSASLQRTHRQYLVQLIAAMDSRL